MIFVIKPTLKRSDEEMAKLHERLVHEANAEVKNKIVCLPSDCSCICINDYNLSDVKIVMED